MELELSTEEDKSPETCDGTLPRLLGKGVEATKVRRWNTVKPKVALVCILWGLR